MSVYSGFATRNQEMVYDSLIGNLLAAMALRIVKFYKQQAVDEKKFRGVVEHQHKYLKKLEKRKFMEPKYAQIVQDMLNKIDKAVYEPQPMLSKLQLIFILRRQKTPQQLNRTLTMITSQLKNLREMGDKEYLTEANSLEKIDERVYKRKRKPRSHSKRNSKNATITYELQELEQVKRQRMPELSNFKVNNEQKFGKSRSDWLRDTKAQLFSLKPVDEQQKVLINDESIKRIMQGTKFRTKMYIKS